MRIAALIALLAVVGCGTGASAPAAGSSGASDLKISYWPKGLESGAPHKWTLKCAPAAGTLAQPGVACRKLLGMQKPFAPIPADAMCTDVYGGPQVAVISGTFRGNRLWAKLQNRNGCEIARFRRLSFLVPGFGTGSEA